MSDTFSDDRHLNVQIDFKGMSRCVCRSTVYGEWHLWTAKVYFINKDNVLFDWYTYDTRDHARNAQWCDKIGTYGRVA